MRFEKKLKLFFRNLVLFMPILTFLFLCMFNNHLTLTEILNNFGASILPNSLYESLLTFLSYIGYDVTLVTSTTFEIFLIGFVFWYVLVHIFFVIIDLLTLPIHWVRILLEKSEVNV